MSIFDKSGDKQVVPLWINGKNLPVQSSLNFEVTQAVENKVVHYAQSASVEDAKAAITAATAAFPSWSKTPLTKRRELLLKAAALLAQRAPELGAMQALETSAPAQFGQMLSYAGAGNIEETAAQITVAFQGNLPHSESDGTLCMSIRQPIGPILLISPWNSPTYLATRGIGTALAAGCTVVLKASELCPATYRMICQVFEDAGIPAGVLNQIVSRREDAAAVTEAIISDARIRKVEFIGSAVVGSIIGTLCGKYLKPILMELGGKCPAIICHDADLAKAAKACAFGAFAHHGQICMSTERIIVVKAVADKFIGLLKKEVEGWAKQAGSAASKQFAEKAHSLVEDALAEGAKLIVGDNSYTNANRTSLRPTIISGVNPASELYDAESFGPSASLFIVDDDAAAVELANSSVYGLNAAIWTNDAMRGVVLGKLLENGVVSINDATVMTDIPATLSGGASKGSGWGTVNGADGIREFLKAKAVVVKSTSP
ncbi:Aldehyde/histidinol dehydrogenase [Xylariales sp. PMI_506]|nr:Aldehyde/histidinol dehydrogenase [Xylariales sp. PMI_506]